MYYVCALMQYRACLHADEDKERLVEGVDLMFKIATKLHNKSKQTRGVANHLQDADHPGDDDHGQGD